jgi:uncharacterized protein
MKTLEEIRATLHAHSGVLRDRYGITDIAVFGSVARGEAREDSDVDIIADVPGNMSLLGIIAAENYLSDILDSKVDFIPRNDIRRELRNRILDEAVAV